MKNVPVSKIKAIIRYFCAHTNPEKLGKVKLMKLFYFLDFQSVKKFGVPVTFDTYFHLDHGPIPSFIKNLVDEVENQPKRAVLSDTLGVNIQIKGASKDFKMHQIVCRKGFDESDLDYFSENEIEALNDVCRRFKDSTAASIEKASHEEAPWKLTRSGERISYLLASQDPDCEVGAEEIELMLKATA